MRLVYLVFYILLHMYTIAATEYIYPVASLGDVILYIHQTSPNTMQLFEWNTITNHTEQILWSLFNPAAVQLLPSNTSFSFIDNGRLRIKAFHKRAPKTIDFDEPIFNINALQWIDEHTCYCSAYYNNHFSLFELGDDGRVDCLMRSDSSDSMYPQKIDDQLFYIERTIKDNINNYTIKQTSYKQAEPQLIVDFSNNPIICLHMISEIEGFAIEHQKDIDDTSAAVLFRYHHILNENNTWQSQVLFTFEVPTYLFLYNNDHRLFESILPLLPRLIDNKIYFVDSSKDAYLKPYYYDCLMNEIHAIDILPENEGHFFVPMQCGDKLCFGGCIGSRLFVF